MKNYPACKIVSKPIRYGSTLVAKKLWLFIADDATTLHYGKQKSLGGSYMEVTERGGSTLISPGSMVRSAR